MLCFVHMSRAPKERMVICGKIYIVHAYRHEKIVHDLWISISIQNPLMRGDATTFFFPFHLVPLCPLVKFECTRVES